MFSTSYQFIETGLRHPQRADMAFVALYTDGIRRSSIPKTERGKGVPLVLMMLRWDGYLGFPGGKVDAGESLLQGVQREAKEEINFKLDPDKANLFCSLAPITFGDTPVDRHIHCFQYELAQRELFDVIAYSQYSGSFLEECQGCVAVQVARFDDGKGGIDEFLKHNFKTTAKLELVELIRLHNWVSF